MKDKKVLREKVRELVKGLKYKLYQTDIRCASHDWEMLIASAKSIRRDCAEILEHSREIAQLRKKTKNKLLTGCTKCKAKTKVL